MRCEINSLAQQAASQHGLLTTSQLRRKGVGENQQRRLVVDGVLIALRRGVFRLVGAPTTWHQSLLAAVLTTGSPLVASHRSALRLWGLSQGHKGLEVSVRYPADRSLDGVTVHRSSDLEREDTKVRDGIPVTSVARSLCDSAAVLSQPFMQRLVDHALATALTSSDELIELRWRLSQHGRAGLRQLEAVIDGAPASGAESGPEMAIRRLLMNAGLPEPVRQHTVAILDRRYRLDLAYPDRMIALEYDGVDVHTRVDRFTEDRRRQNDVLTAGWLVLRYTHVDLRDRPEAVITQVRRALLDRQPTLDL